MPFLAFLAFMTSHSFSMFLTKTQIEQTTPEKALYLAEYLKEKVNPMPNTRERALMLELMYNWYEHIFLNQNSPDFLKNISYYNLAVLQLYQIAYPENGYPRIYSIELARDLSTPILAQRARVLAANRNSIKENLAITALWQMKDTIPQDLGIHQWLAEIKTLGT
jgi:hypothetical protein